jgi:hypothetical protein
LLNGLPGGRDDWTTLRQWFAVRFSVDGDDTPAASSSPRDRPRPPILTTPEAPTPEAPDEITLTMWRDLRDTRGMVKPVSWSALCARVSTPLAYPDKQSTPLWTFAAMPSGRTRRTPPPPLDDVSALVLDYDDDPTVTPDALVSRWGRWTFAAHTTASHGISKRGKPALPRWRVIIPLRDALTWDDFGAVATWASRHDPGLSDEHAHRGRMWHLPAAGERYQHVVHHGRLLSLPAIIESMCRALG